MLRPVKQSITLSLLSTDDGEHCKSKPTMNLPKGKTEREKKQLINTSDVFNTDRDTRVYKSMLQGRLP